MENNDDSLDLVCAYMGGELPLETQQAMERTTTSPVLLRSVVERAARIAGRDDLRKVLMLVERQCRETAPPNTSMPPQLEPQVERAASDYSPGDRCTDESRARGHGGH